MRARHRTSKLLLRQGIVYAGGTAWTAAHHHWLGRQRFTQPGLTQPVIQRVGDGAAHRRPPGPAGHVDRQAGRRSGLVADGQPAVLPAGVSTLTAFGLTVEVGDWSRFTGSSIGAFLGLVPTEHSSGASRSQGSITKTGNTHARRLLVEAAWHHKRPYRPSKALRTRWQQAPAAARARGHAGNQRLHQRWQAFDERNKPPVVANVAVARELAGWCWSLANAGRQHGGLTAPDRGRPLARRRQRPDSGDQPLTMDVLGRVQPDGRIDK